MSRFTRSALYAAIAALGAAFIVLYLAAGRAAEREASGDDSDDAAASVGLSERSARNGMVALNAAANLILWSMAGLPWIGVPVALIVLLAASEDLSRDIRYKRVLGWTSWLSPMSWPVMMVGAMTLMVDLAVHAVAGERWEQARVHSVKIDSDSGTVVTEGGILVKPGFRGGFNFGGFSFLTPQAQSVAPHEAGHALNLAAFGWVFHLAGGFERKVRPDPLTAYAERLAEGNRLDSKRSDRVRMWLE